MTSFNGGKVFMGSTLVAGGIVGNELPHVATGSTSGLWDVANAQISLTFDASAHAWSTWVQVDASTARDYSFLEVWLSSGASFALSGSNGSGLVEIGVGGSGSEVSVGIFNMGNRSNSSIIDVACPIPTIAAGSRIAMRVMTVSRTGQAITMMARLSDSSPAAPAAIHQLGVTIGSSKGTSVAATATSGTWGAWTEISSSTPAAFQAVHLGVGLDGNTNTGNSQMLVQLGVGTAGNEVALPESAGFTCSSGEAITPLRHPLLRVQVPAGSRLCARTMRQSSNTIACDVIVHGIGL